MKAQQVAKLFMGEYNSHLKSGEWFIFGHDLYYGRHHVATRFPDGDVYLNTFDGPVKFRRFVKTAKNHITKMARRVFNVPGATSPKRAADMIAYKIFLLMHDFSSTKEGIVGLLDELQEFDIDYSDDLAALIRQSEVDFIPKRLEVMKTWHQTLLITSMQVQFSGEETQL